jgi:Tol biopolymer transport system component
VYWVDPSFSGSFAADGLELFRVPAAGGAPHSLGVKTLVHDDFLSLAPTGDRLAVAVGGGRESWDNKRIGLIDWASGAVRYLTDERTAAIYPSWSRDGSRLAYVGLPEGLDRSDLSGPARLFLGKRRIWVADAAGSSQPVRLTSDDRYRDEEPMWLADGRHILFCRIRPGPVGRDGEVQSTNSVWLMDAQGGGVTQVAGPLQGNDTFEGEGWFGYYGTIDWRAVMDCRGGGK